ncbi:hypothetical protein ABZ807_25015 [Micromonospora sp. NPDC047548]|uniref:hypothetical protein n=1 Tax=Micromonospora sp. NPDC047548 TaxID=3155624 RepID=UPI00340AA4EC
MATHLELFADYHQLHLFDEGSTTEFSSAWTPQATTDKIAVARDALGVGTTVNVLVSVTIDTLTQAPPNNSEIYDHVTEASILVESGRLIVMGCTDFAPEAERITVPPGWLRVRVSRSNLGIAEELAESSDEDPSTMEKVLIEVWPAPQTATAVVKRWQPN